MFEQCKKVQLLNKYVWVLLGQQHHYGNDGEIILESKVLPFFRLPNEGTVLISGLIWNNSSYSSFSQLKQKILFSSIIAYDIYPLTEW